MRDILTSLRFRLVAAFLLVSLPPMLFAAQLASEAVATAFQQNVATWLHETSAFFIEDMRETEQEAMGMASYLAMQTDVTAAILDKKQDLPEPLTRLVSAAGYDFVAIFDQNRSLVYSSRPVDAIQDLRFSDDHTLSRVKSGNQTFVMNFALHPFEHKGVPYFLMVGTWLDSNSLGVLSAVSDLELRLYYRDNGSFREFYSSRATTDELLDTNIADAVVHSNTPRYVLDAENGRYLALYTPLLGHSGEINGILFCGLRSYASISTWFGRPNLYLLILLIGTGLSVLAGLFVSSRLTSPLRALVKGVRAITGGDYRQLVAVQGRDEVSALARAFNDMSERLLKSEELESQLRRRQRLSALGEVAVGIAHEVRNPLGIIKTSADLVRQRAHLAETDQRLLEYVGDEVRRIDTLIREFLIFAKPRPPDLRTVSPVEVVHRIATVYAPELDRARVSLEIHDRSAGATIEADEDQLFQALLNLVLNAIEAMPEGGLVSIDIALVQKGLEIAVSDTGIGISQEVQDRIFNPFFTTKPQGSGLGLAKVFAIMEAHWGRVECRSRAGEGASFILGFPTSGKVTGNVA